LDLTLKFNICSTSVQLRFRKSREWVAETVAAMEQVGILVRDGDDHRIKFIDIQLERLNEVRGVRADAGRKSAEARAKKSRRKSPLASPQGEEEKSTQEKRSLLNECSTNVEHKPTQAQAKAYAAEIRFTGWESWFDHFEANGWKVGGKAPMKDWKAAMRNGKRMNGGTANGHRNPAKLTNTWQSENPHPEMTEAFQ
jgi:hypothetical protein